MSFDPAHDYAVLYAAESGDIDEGDDETAPALPAAPGSPVLLGYLKSTPEIDHGLNNSLGFAVGSANALYRKPGVRAPKASFKLLPTNLTFLNRAQRVSGRLPNLAFWFVKPGKRCIRTRFTKIQKLALNLNEANQGEAVEIDADINLEALATEIVTPPAISLPTLMLALDKPMFWHDVRSLMITDAEGNATDFRKGIMSLSMTIEHELERKNSRGYWGDDVPLSSTAYELLEHNERCGGEMRLHGGIPDDYLYGIVNAQEWGPIIGNISDSPYRATGARTWTVTSANPYPANVTEAGTESNAQLSSTIPYLATSLTLAAS